MLGIDSEFCNVEALVTGIVDNWPDQLLKHRRKFTIAICVFMFALGVPMCTEGGVFLFQLMDFYRWAFIANVATCLQGGPTPRIVGLTMILNVPPSAWFCLG